MATREPDEPTGGQLAGGPDDGTAGQTRTDEVRAATGTGLDPNQGAAIAYLLGALTAVLVLVLEDDEFVRFHAVQSIALTVVAVGAYVVLGVVTTVFAFVPLIGGLFVALFAIVSLLIGLAGFGVWLFAMYQAYSGEWFEFPIVGGFARRY
ncbi:DUF4870 domain-containing protein [Halorientalis pallida]|uniref:DUF4870 domain-containing protein n=1 Tax=Halorientalis pallida TaxID=2479928 RepID=A0A498L218_9EURY|nr:DUF4870 domain-containing protein [Halorientalis pallida]RXK48647.1 hypothetical protein EAF64_13315 [Halorientalis pallida]